MVLHSICADSTFWQALQVEAARLPLFGTKNLQQRVYFGVDYLLDRRRRSHRGVKDFSTGRAWQIFSLTTSNWRLSSRKRCKASTSRSAVRKTTGDENDSLTGLPLTFLVRR